MPAKEDEVVTEDGCSDLIIMPRNRESSERKFPEKEKQNWQIITIAVYRGV